MITPLSAPPGRRCLEKRLPAPEPSPEQLLLTLSGHDAKEKPRPLELGAIFFGSFGVALAIMMSGPALPPAATPAIVATVDTGRATVYSPGVWESTEHTRASWLNPGLYDGPDGAHRRELVEQQAVIAVNPARYLPAYQPLLEQTIRQATVGLAPGSAAYESAAIRALKANQELAALVNGQLIGRVVHARLPDGSLHELVVMDVFEPQHAAVDLGLLNGSTMSPRPAASFVGDFHNEWLRRTLGVAFDFSRGTYVDAAGQPTAAPAVSLEEPS